ncbi:MAG: DUF1294 domain-containing protein [Lachnospiraceae bacterium]|nr:DUF1294 domain-containing protein [Lachnospiraceae bacterium]
MKLIIPGIVLLYLNMLSFSLMKEDEVRAREHARRVPVITLFLSAGLFGAVGGIIATHSLHQRINHWNYNNRALKNMSSEFLTSTLGKILMYNCSIDNCPNTRV